MRSIRDIRRPYGITRMCSTFSTILLCKLGFYLSSFWIRFGHSDYDSIHSVVPTYAKNDKVHDMCCLKGNHPPILLAVTTSNGKLLGFNAETTEFMWRADEILPDYSSPMRALGVTTDGQEHLFVRDMNAKCIHLFSPDGKFIRTVVKKGECDILSIRRIRWSKKTGSLVIVHSSEKRKQYFISILKV